MKANSRIINSDGHIVEDLEAIFDLMQASSFDRARPLLIDCKMPECYVAA